VCVLHGLLCQLYHAMWYPQVDLLYLHNSAEVLLPALGRVEYMERLEEAFRVCESEWHHTGTLQSHHTVELLWL
jgi:hypothetical protein